MLISIHRIPKPNNERITEAEFNLTSQMMDILDIYPDEEYFCYVDNDNTFIPEPLIRGTRQLSFAERYSSIKNIKKENPLFRPFFTDGDADIVYSIIESKELIDYDSLEIKEKVNDSGKTKYSGWLMKNNEMVEGSHILSAPTIPILKMSIVAALLMDADDHSEFMTNLKVYLHSGGIK